MERVIYSVEILSILVKQTVRRTKSASGRLITKKTWSIVDYVNHFHFEYHGLSFNLHREVFWTCFFFFYILFFKSTKLYLHSLKVLITPGFH